MGFYGVFVGLQYQHDLAISKALDNGIYDDANAVTLKIPVSIPYMVDQAEFERAEGKFEHKGQLYRLVKQKYSQDTLTVICVKDILHAEIDLAMADYVKTFTDQGSEGSHQTSIVSFIKEYLPVSLSIDSINKGWTLSLPYSSFGNHLKPSFLVSIIHPPERA